MGVRGRIAVAVAGLVLLLAPGVHAQTLDGVEEIAFERPEAWAMAWFGSLTRMSGLAAPRPLEPWAIELAVELDWVPRLSDEQQRVGFNGVKLEDLNRSSVLGRPRLRMGLPASFAVELGWIPPVEIDGATPNVFALAFDRPLAMGDRWSLGVRIFGQAGTVEGDFTCPADVAAEPPGSAGNPYGCEGRSEDEVTLDHAGGAVVAGWRGERVAFHAELAATYMDLEFQVGARTFGLEDRTRLLADGWVPSIAVGAAWRLSDRFELGAEVACSHLEVQRPGSGRVETDPLLNVRSIVRYRWR